MSQRNLRLLSLDGGGVRSLTTLLTLKVLMHAVNEKSPPLPYEYFDMIGGTSSGGLLAIMLGRLQMTIDECIKTFIQIAPTIYKRKSRIPWRLKMSLRPQLDSHSFEEALKHVIRSRVENADAIFEDPSSLCKVFVSATAADTNRIICFKSYQSNHSLGDIDHVKIWEAARATSATPTLFDPIIIGMYNQKFLDGGLGANNPVHLLWQEASDIWSLEAVQSRACIVSLGTGKLRLSKFDGTIMNIAKALVDIVTDSERIADDFTGTHRDLVEKDRYFRFNVDRGLEDTMHGEIQAVESPNPFNFDAIASATAQYLKSPYVRNQIERCSRALETVETTLAPHSSLRLGTELVYPDPIGKPDNSGHRATSLGSSTTLVPENVTQSVVESSYNEVILNNFEIRLPCVDILNRIGPKNAQDEFLKILRNFHYGLKAQASDGFELEVAKVFGLHLRKLAKILIDSLRAESSQDGKDTTSSVQLETSNQEIKENMQDIGEMVTMFLSSGEPFNKFCRDTWLLANVAAKEPRVSFLESTLVPKDYVFERLDFFFSNKKTKSRTLTITAYWDLLAWFRAEAAGITSMKSLLVVSGTETDAFASSCVDYCKFQWPHTGLYVLEQILDAIDFPTAKEAMLRKDRILIVKIDEETEVLPERATFIIKGSFKETSDIIQQLAWLGLVFRIPEAEKLTYVDWDLTQSGLSRFDLTYSTSAVVQHRLCWHPLFAGFVMAKGFPIPSRQGETGLELPLDAMISLAATECTLLLDEGYVFHGYNTVLFPVHQLTSGTVQWHAIRAEENLDSGNINKDTPTEPILMKAVSERRLKVKDIAKFEDICKYRIILGYSRQVHINLGTLGPDYGNLQAKDLKLEGDYWRRSGLSWSVNASKIVGAGVGQSYSLNKSIQAKMDDSKANSYEGLLEALKVQPVLLYDTSDRRGWLVPAINVVLHMIHMRMRIWRISNPTNAIPFVKNLGDRSVDLCSATEDILKLGTTEIYTSGDGEAVTLSKWVWEFWSTLQGLGTAAYDKTLPRRAGLCGWEITEIARGGSKGHNRREYHKCNAIWKNLVQQSRIVVLFGGEFGSVIESSTAICDTWMTVPPGEDLLTACIYLMVECGKISRKAFVPLKDFHQNQDGTLNWPHQACFDCSAGPNEECSRRIQDLGKGVFLGKKYTLDQSSFLRGAVVFGERRSRYHGAGHTPQKVVVGTDGPEIGESASIPEVHNAEIDSKLSSKESTSAFDKGDFYIAFFFVTILIGIACVHRLFFIIWFKMLSFI